MKKALKNDLRFMQEDYMLSEREVAELAKVSINTVRHWRQKGVLPSVKIGKYPRIWLSVFNKTFQKPE